MSQFVKRKAARSRVKLKMQISGLPGAGKTYGALRLAYGITGDWSRITVIDTENASDLFADMGAFNVIEFRPPYSAEHFIGMIDQEAMSDDCDVLIIDSFSHSWMGEGGILDEVGRLGSNPLAWRRMTPVYTQLISKIINVPMHIILTIRQREAVSVEGKQAIKVGAKDQMRDGLAYELHLSLTTDRDSHYAHAEKDRTKLLANRAPFFLTPEVGAELLRWCDDPAAKKTTVRQELNMLLRELDACSVLDYQATVKKLKERQVTDETAQLMIAKIHRGDYSDFEEMAL